MTCWLKERFDDLIFRIDTLFQDERVLEKSKYQEEFLRRGYVNKENSTAFIEPVCTREKYRKKGFETEDSTGFWYKKILIK